MLFSFFEGRSQTRIEVNIPTPEMESAYIWRTIQDIAFFEQNNYQISLPNGSLIETLKKKAKENSLSEADYNKLKVFIRDSVYKKSRYEHGYEKIKNQLPLINQMLEEINQSERNWDFKEFNVYQVNLTLYGSGGSFNPDEGSILIFTTPNGAFKNYHNPANTIIHEIIHIGIEASMITTYGIPHALKERIVDTFVALSFKKYLPDYKIQDMGDRRIDKYLKTKEDIKDLNKFAKIIMEADE